MKERNVEILKQIRSDLQSLRACGGLVLMRKRKELSKRVSAVLEDEQRRLDEFSEEEVLVVTDEKMNSLFSANAILSDIPKNEAEMLENIESAIGMLERCIA